LTNHQQQQQMSIDDGKKIPRPIGTERANNRKCNFGVGGMAPGGVMGLDSVVDATMVAPNMAAAWRSSGGAQQQQMQPPMPWMPSPMLARQFGDDLQQPVCSLFF
jgi:hypothetical protein